MRKLDVCNMALLRVGSEILNDIDDPVRNAILCRQYYTPMAQTVLADFDWSEATIRVSLDEDTLVTNHTGYTHAYALPADCLRVLSVINDETHPWEREGAHLFTDLETPILARYIRDISEEVNDTLLYSAGVADCIALQMAIKMTPIITPGKATNHLALLHQEYQMALQKAKGVAAMGSVNDEPPLESWVE